MADFKVIENQEDFDKAIQSRLERERAKIEKEQADKYKKYLSPDDVTALKTAHESAIADIKKTVDDLTAKAESHKAEIETITQRATAAENRLLKSKIAHENGVPLELADRLIGEDEETLKKDAEKVAGYLKPTNAAPLMTTEPGAGNGNSNNAMSQALAQMIPQLIPPTQ